MLGLESLQLTNGECATVQRLAHFIRFIKSMNASVPQTREELDTLLTQYIKMDRHEQMVFVSMLRVERGDSPLPASLLKYRHPKPAKNAMNYRPTWDLSTVPDELLKAERARRNSAKRTTKSGGRKGGRPKIERPCPKCGESLGAREMLRHHC